MSDALAAVAAETVALCTAGSYVSASGVVVDIRAVVDAAVAGTRLYRDDELRALVAARAAPARVARVRCLEERSGACAGRLLGEGRRRVAVLNYANGVRPGGGFLVGARAQEEALCRCSGLYACLSGAGARAFYDDNRAAGSALVRGHVLVSPAVPFFRTEDLALLDAPFVVTVLTCAAPDLGRLRAAIARGKEPPERLDEVPAIFAERTGMVLAAARAAGCDAVVAGPWGCGAFGNDPDVVAGAFAAAVARHGDAFDDVVFATWGPPDNRAAFERRFASVGPH